MWDLEVMTVNVFSTLLKALKLGPHHQMQITVISKTSQNWSLTTWHSLLSYPGHLRTGASPPDAVYCHIQYISEQEPHHLTQFTVIPRTSQNWSLTTRHSLLSYPVHLRTGASPPDAVYCHTQDISVYYKFCWWCNDPLSLHSKNSKIWHYFGMKILPVCINLTLPPWSEYDTRLISKWSTTFRIFLLLD